MPPIPERSLPASDAPAPLTPEEVARIAAIEDPVERNHRITAGYEALARSLLHRLGPDTRGNWCAFAIRASRQAGRTIRGEDAEALLRRELARDPAVERFLTVLRSAAVASGVPLSFAAVREAVFDALRLSRVVEETGKAVALGNRKVFGEVGRIVAHFLASPDGSIDGAALGLREGEPPGGDDTLLRAAGRYRDLLAATDPKGRAELLYLGNLEIAIHEQLRIQPEIEAAMSAGLPTPAEFRERLLGRILPESIRRHAGILGAVRDLVRGLFRRPLPIEREIDRIAESLRSRVRTILTRTLMTIELPDGREVSLHADLTGSYSPSLLSLEHPELTALLARIDPNPDSLLGSGATDWAIYAERIHFVAELFRCHQEDARILE